MITHNPSSQNVFSMFFFFFFFSLKDLWASAAWLAWHPQDFVEKSNVIFLGKQAVRKGAPHNTKASISYDLKLTFIAQEINSNKFPL